MILKDKTAIVTGAASGIGQATSVRFAREGANVAIVDMNAAGLAETEAACGEAGAKS
ncbi:MAG: SDR family NAD(P)-dependent oxidoreductase, partial [Nitrospinota bacterium]|nr:SDR family NAD(P)-dependent oxidoreductase [Nitrospinota bacterium]